MMRWTDGLYGKCCENEESPECDLYRIFLPYKLYLLEKDLARAGKVINEEYIRRVEECQ